MPEYLISQHDPRGERTEQLAAVKAAHTYNVEYGFPVAAGVDDGNGPSRSWRLKAAREQERIRLNLVEMRRRGRWDFVNDLQPLAPRKARHDGARERCRRALGLLHARARAAARILDRRNSLKEFQDDLHDHQAARRRGPVRNR